MTDAEWMAAAAALGEGARGTTAPNPNVGCLIVNNGEVVGRASTRPGGRPHAEAVALAEAGERAHGATVYVTLEPCAHQSTRGPACVDLLTESGIARAVIAVIDPDPRTCRIGIRKLGEAGIEIAETVGLPDAARSLAGYLSRVGLGRPFVTLKLAMSIDGQIALASGESRWITGEEARRDVHEQRARADMILVGRGTFEADRPSLDVRIAGLEDRSPRKAMLTSGEPPEGWTRIAAPADIAALHDVNDLLVEGGAGAAAAFLGADLVDRLLVYRAPIVIGDGKAAIGDIGLDRLDMAHGRWVPAETRMLGIDRLEVYERRRD